MKDCNERLPFFGWSLKTDCNIMSYGGHILIYHDHNLHIQNRISVLRNRPPISGPQTVDTLL